MHTLQNFKIYHTIFFLNQILLIKQFKKKFKKPEFKFE
jgi:hypothetical protein